MRKQLVTALLFSSAILLAENSNAQISQVGNSDNWYFNFNSNNSVSLEEDSIPAFYTPGNISEETGDFSTSVGYSFINEEPSAGTTRFEAEFLWNDLQNKEEKTNGSNFTAGVMANIFYDFNTGSNLTPYLGAGAGVANVTNNIDAVNGSITSSNSTTPAYQAMTGVSYYSELYPYTSIRVGYRYFSAVAPEARYSSHILDTGIQVSF